MKKILTEWKRYLNESLTPLELQNIRISIGKKIQKYVLTATDREALYYVYRGGRKGRGEYIEEAKTELHQRVDNLIQNMEPIEQAVFVKDFKYMIPLVIRDSDASNPTAHPTYKFKHGTSPPGRFSTVAMGGGLGGDFMFKNSNELSNIKPMHSQFFEFPNVLGLIKGTATESTLPPEFPYENLTADGYHYNYKRAELIDKEPDAPSRLASHPALNFDAWKKSKGLAEGE